MVYGGREELRGSEVNFQFSLFFIEENGSYRKFSSVYEKVLFVAKVIDFWNIENTYNYIARANFNHDFPEKYLNIVSSPTVFEVESWNLVVMFYASEVKISKFRKSQICFFNNFKKLWSTESFVLVPRKLLPSFKTLHLKIFFHSAESSC